LITKSAACANRSADDALKALLGLPEFPPIDGVAVAEESSDEFRIA